MSIAAIKSRVIDILVQHKFAIAVDDQWAIDVADVLIGELQRDAVELRYELDDIIGWVDGG